jgi:cobalt-zinc-cadmium resistance protein CzcA
LILGVVGFKNIDIEAYPDFTNPLVHIVTKMPGKSAEDIERLVTIPLEKELNGIPNEQKLYSTSIFGLCILHVVFDDIWGITSPLIRQQAMERIYKADIPDNVKPELGPDTSAIGEIYRYSLVSDFYKPMSLKAIQDWQLVKLFKQIPGIIDVTSFGGPVKTYKIALDQERIRFYNLIYVKFITQ